MKERVSVLKKAIRAAEADIAGFPDGRLRVSKKQLACSYYVVTKRGDPTGDYISVKNKELVKQLAQKDYNKQFLKQAENELQCLQRAVSSLDGKNADAAFCNLSDERRSLVTPYILTDDLYAGEWQAMRFKTNTFMSEDRIYDTERGEKVRSKSEVLIANTLLELGIPYHYEKMLVLKNGGTRYPDFTLLDVRAREEVFLEHFGMLDDEEYRRNCLHKLDEYRNNGIYPGRNLIFTYETEENPLDIKGIKKMLKDLFKV
ncbi:MAG: hypothetical protein K6G60_07460 [Lachnospiraceae bacterium]|nr:hypothetical protein [Lachnospiraceae bacterium]